MLCAGPSNTTSNQPCPNFSCLLELLLLLLLLFRETGRLPIKVPV